jgi:hypothetical protein
MLVLDSGSVVAAPRGRYNVKFYVIALTGIALIAMGCSEEDSGNANVPEQALFDTLAVCAPEEPSPNSRACIPEDKAVYYKGMWKAKFMVRNGIDEDYFDRHVSSVWTSSNCWSNGITFTVNYRMTIDWAVVDRADKIVVMLYSSSNAYQYLDIPRDVFLDDGEVDLILDNRVFDSSVGPVLPLEHLPYANCSEAVLAFQDSTESSDILPTHIAYYVPGKVPREDGYPYFIGRGEVDLEENICIKGHFNLFTGDSDAWFDACIVE